jgi:hypothetical protein
LIILNLIYKYKKGRILFLEFCFAVPCWSYSIGDSPSDAIGVRGFEGYGININNFTPGYNSGNISFDIFSNYPQSGLKIGGWQTYAADLFIFETYHGTQYPWAIPLVDHGGFSAGTFYAVGSYKVSDDFDPGDMGYIYNHNVPVRLETVGNNYGYSSIGGGSVSWNTLPGSPDFRININTTGFWEDDPEASLALLWGTATCGNDVIEGSVAPVPEPATMLLLGSGLLGFAGMGRRKFRRKAKS